ncbi:hypothetical protein Q7P37_009737 [Cladosporium fusiforme]
MSEQTRWSSGEARSICRDHHFAFDEEQQSRRKVYDLVLLSTELDWLDIRLHTLAHFVDYFVVIESPTTFTGNPKPLYLNDNWYRYKDFHDKIIYRVVEDQVQSRRIWDHEDFLRNSLLESVFPGLTGTEQPKAGDVLIVSDVDEIIRPEAALLLRHCNIPARLILRTSFYYYSFQWLHRGPQWAHPDATVYQGPTTISPNDLRQNLLGEEWAPIASLRRWWDRGTLWNAGWHCSSCFATVAEMRTKMHSFSHQTWNTAENRELDTIVHRVRNGKDLFGRAGEYYDKVEDNKDVPPYVLEQFAQSGKFTYLLNRDGINAAFDDFVTVNEYDV